MTEQERLEYLNEYLQMDYTSLEDIDWLFVSSICVLSEDFIRIFQDKVVWHKIIKYQQLSDEFKEEFKDKIEESKLIYAKKKLISK